MPYKVEHKASCENKNRFIVRREVFQIEDRRGVILSNNDPGKVLSIICESCRAPAVWK